MKEKKQRKTNAEQLLIVEKLRPIDDGFFEVMMEDPDTCEELLQIFLNLVHRNNMDITNEALEKVKNIIEKSSKSSNFGNGRYIRNIFQKILIEHSKNIEKYNLDENIFFTDDILLIDKDDINYEKLIFEGKDSKKIGF